MVGFVDADVRERFAVSAPAALERERVEREHEHAAAEVAVRDVDLVVGLDDANFFELADDHRRSGRILRAKRGAACGLRCDRRGVGRGLRQERRDGAASALPRLAVVGRRQADGAAVLALGRARDLRHHAAGARIVFAHGVLAEVHEACAVDVHAVTLRRIERADDAAGAIEVNHRRRTRAAQSERRGELRMQLDVREVVRPVVDPDVVVAVEREPRDAAELPEIRQVLWPGRIEDELGRPLCAGDRGSACRDEPCADEDSGPHKRRATSHGSSGYEGAGIIGAKLSLGNYGAIFAIVGYDLARTLATMVLNRPQASLCSRVARAL